MGNGVDLLQGSPPHYLPFALLSGYSLTHTCTALGTVEGREGRSRAWILSSASSLANKCALRTRHSTKDGPWYSKGGNVRDWIRPAGRVLSHPCSPPARGAKHVDRWGQTEREAGWSRKDPVPADCLELPWICHYSPSCSSLHLDSSGKTCTGEWPIPPQGIWLLVSWGQFGKGLKTGEGQLGFMPAGMGGVQGEGSATLHQDVAPPSHCCGVQVVRCSN